MSCSVSFVTDDAVQELIVDTQKISLRRGQSTTSRDSDSDEASPTRFKSKVKAKRVGRPRHDKENHCTVQCPARVRPANAVVDKSDGVDFNMMAIRARLAACSMNTDTFFEAQADANDKKATSAASVLHKRIPRLSRRDLNFINLIEQTDTLVDQVVDRYAKAIDHLSSAYMTQFAKWATYLLADFNLLFYGFGSKKAIIEQFVAAKLASDHEVVIVNGFFPSMTAKAVLNAISDSLGITAVGAAGLADHVNAIRSHLDACADGSGSMTPPVALVIHSIDAVALRTHRFQSTMARLASHPMIHFICSVDQVRSPLIWDANLLSQFRFASIDATTFRMYRDETRFETHSSVLMQQAVDSTALALTSLTRVFASLTSNSRQIYLLIVRFQLQANSDKSGVDEEAGTGDMDDDEYSSAASNRSVGISFSELASVARSRFLINSDLTLRVHLTEFIDHKLVTMRVGTQHNDDGVEYLHIPLDDATLTEFLEQHDAGDN